MAVKEGYVHPRFSGDVDEIDRFIQRLRRDMGVGGGPRKGCPRPNHDPRDWVRSSNRQVEGDVL